MKADCLFGDVNIFQSYWPKEHSQIIPICPTTVNTQDEAGKDP